MTKPKTTELKQKTTELTPKTIHEKIKTILEAMTDVLLHRKMRYAGSILEPVLIFNQGEIYDSLYVHMDDKLACIKKRPKYHKPSLEDVADIIGYAILILVEMGATKEQILALKNEEWVRVNLRTNEQDNKR